MIPRLFHRAAASLASLLPGRGDSQPPRRRDRVLDQALANLLREAEKSTHDDIVKRIPARLHRLDQAVRRHGDPDLARARLQDGARAYLRNVDGPTLQALRRFDGGNADFYHMRGRGTDGARLGRERELGNLVAEEALLRSCELALAGALARETPGSVARGLAAVLDEIPLRRLVPAGDAERVGIWDGASSQVRRRARDQHAALIEKTLAMPSSQDTSLRRLAGALTGRLDADARERLGELARALPSDADAPGATQDAGMRQGRLLLALLADASRNPA